MNHDLIEQFSVLQKYYKNKKDVGRLIAYSKAISALKTVRKKITDVSQLTGVRGIGPKVKAKVDEYLKTGKICLVEEIKEETSLKNPENVLHEVWGIGPVKAATLQEKGITTIEKLRKNQHLLTSQQKLGLKYFEDLRKQIPRETIQNIEIIMKIFMSEAFGGNSYVLRIAGSYRRGKEESGDIDCVISPVKKSSDFFATKSSDKITLEKVVSLFREKRLIKDILSMRHEKFMGIGGCPSGNVSHFRLDIEFVPETEFGSALLYFTGSKDFNIYMRGIAKAKGYVLNEHGLFSDGKKILHSPTEKDIFKKIGIPYLPPDER